jgi:hypothetical protein
MDRRASEPLLKNASPTSKLAEIIDWYWIMQMKQTFIGAYTETGNGMRKHLEADLKNRAIILA